MIRYVAFLRGINVGGYKLIKMQELARIFESLGFKSVRTFIQSGNVIFEAREKSADGLARKIEKGLEKALGYDVDVCVTPLSELESIAQTNPFNKIKTGPNVRLFVTFFVSEPTKKPNLPLKSDTENLEVVKLGQRRVFMVLRRKKNGRFSFQ